MTEADRVIVEQMISQRVKEAVEAAIGKNAANGNAAVLRRDIAFELPAAMRVNGARTEQGAGPDSDVANTQVGEHGMRASDAWGWTRVTATNIMLNNVYIGYDGKMAEYSSASALTIGTTPTIVYAIVTWSKTDGEITGISSVTFATTTDWDTARNPVLDSEGKQTALHVPIAKFKYATGTWGSTIQCQKRYLDGALMLAAKSGQGVPDGDSTHIALKWDTTNTVWVKAEPVEADDSASTSATRYVTSISASSTPDVLLTYTTAPISGLTADDFESIDVYVPGAEWDGDGIQFKKRTLKVLKTTAAATDSDRIDFAPYYD